MDQAERFDAALILPFLVVALPTLYLSNRLYKRLFASTPKNDPAVTGIGRGAPGFLTSVKKVQVPAHLMARIRAGEDVSAEEVTAAIEEEQRKAQAEESTASARKVREGVDEDWLPKEQQSSGSSSKGRRRKK